MKNILKIVAVVALCAAISACSPQPIGSGSFPSGYGAASSPTSSISIMDY